MTTTLLPNGTLSPHSFNFNETYWASIGRHLIFKNHFGQTTTVFAPGTGKTFRGKFIYNRDIEHVLSFD